MRRSFGIALAGTAVLAALFALLALWLPAMRAQQDRAWDSAGQRALAVLRLPGSFAPHSDAGARTQVCVTGPSLRCFLGAGTPKDLLPPLQAALADAATGAVRNSCEGRSSIPGSPVSCTLTVPVKGSTLVADVFARAETHGKRIEEWTYDGSYVSIRIGDR